MQERPDELARDVFEPELEMRVLIHRVVTGVERQRADRVALPVRDLGGPDDARRVAGARRGNRAVERCGRSGSECDDGWRGGEHEQRDYSVLDADLLGLG